MAIDPESFDEPVKDYDFSSVSSPGSLIDQMATAGGFTATKLAYARDILVEMKKEIDEYVHNDHNDNFHDNGFYKPHNVHPAT